MASTNNFKIFDESLTNLLSYSNYVGNSQRVNGFAPDEEFPSALFNSILRQNSILSYGLIDYMKAYVSNNITVEHDMNFADLATFISTFFNNYFTSKLNDTDITYHMISMGDEEVDGCLLYSYNLGLTTIYPPTTGTFNNLTHYIVEYYKDSNNKVLPGVKKLEVKEVKNLNFTTVNDIKICRTDLSSLVSDIVSNLSKYEILMEIYEQIEIGNVVSNIYKSEVIPLNRLDSIGYHYTGSSSELTGNHKMIIDSPLTEYHLFVGLANTNTDDRSPSIGKYLTIIDMTGLIENCSINISLKERI